MFGEFNPKPLGNVRNVAMTFLGLTLTNLSANQILYSSSSTNAISGITVVNSAGLLTNGSGVPGWVAYTGTGAPVLATSPTLVTPALGTPSSGVLTNCTGLPISTGVSGLGTGVATFLATPSSANLLAAMTTSTGTGNIVFATNPVLVTPNIGTPSAGTLTNCIGLPLTTGVTGILPLANGGTNANLPASNGGIVWSNASQLQILSGTATANQVLLSGSTATPAWSTATYPATTTINQILYSSSSNAITGITVVNSAGLLTNGSGIPGWVAYTGSGAPVLATSPSLVTPLLGTPTSGTLTNCTGLPLTTGVTGILPSANGGTGVNNGTSTITIGGNVAFSGAFTFNGTLVGNTSVTFPTSGTLATVGTTIPSSNTFFYSFYGGF